MEKVVKTKNKILTSAIFLSIAGFLTKIIGVFYKVPLLEIVGSEGLGFYQLVFPVFVFVLILSSAYYLNKYENKNTKNKINIISSVILFVLFGLSEILLNIIN